MKDPKGDLPWEEDESAQDVIHILDVASFNKLLKKEKDKDLLVMVRLSGKSTFVNTQSTLLFYFSSTLLGAAFASE